jgi:uncharacterized protein
MDHQSSIARGISEWARSRADIIALALVGSRARGSARPDSDVDFVILASDPSIYRTDSKWLTEILWPPAGAGTVTWHDANYGNAWSRHISLTDGTVVELTFVSADWARIEPIDPGTRAVVRGGCRILWDPHAMLSRLVAAMAG